MKFFHSAPETSELIASIQRDLRGKHERDAISMAHRLLLTDYNPMTKQELHEYFIQIEKIAIILMPYANKHQTVARAFITRLNEIDKLLIEMGKKEELGNDVSAQTDHGIMFN